MLYFCHMTESTTKTIKVKGKNQNPEAKQANTIDTSESGTLNNRK